MERRTPTLTPKPQADVSLPASETRDTLETSLPSLEIPAPRTEESPASRREPALDADPRAASEAPLRRTFWGMRKKNRQTPQASAGEGLFAPARPGARPVYREKSGGGFGIAHVFFGLFLALLAVTILPVVLLRVVPAFTSSFMLHYQFERLTADRDLPALQHDWVSWEQISPQIKLAVIAAEDQKFPVHRGLDFEAIEKAVEHNQRSRRKRGASTITQQTAKNLFLSSTRSMTRKGVELGYTLMIEAMWPKRRILEVYLNIAEFGEGVYGVEAAARRYFGKPASKLTSYEAALMAAVLPNPKRLRLAAPSGYVQGRASSIQGQMARLGTAYLKDL